MAFVIRYSLKKGYIPTKDTIKACDDGAKGMQEVLIEVAKIGLPKMVWLIWLLTRFYKRTITKDAITYNFYLFPSNEKLEEKPCECPCHSCGTDGCMICDCRKPLSIRKDIKI